MCIALTCVSSFPFPRWLENLPFIVHSALASIHGASAVSRVLKVFNAAVTLELVLGPMQTRRSAVRYLHRIFISVSEGPTTSHSAATTSHARAYHTRPAAPHFHHRWQLQRTSRRQFAAEAQEVDVGAQLLEEARRRNKLWQRFGILGMLLKYTKLPCTQRLVLQSLWSTSLLWEHFGIELGNIVRRGCKWAILQVLLRRVCWRWSFTRRT